MSQSEKVSKRKHIAAQEIERLERLVEARKARVDDAVRKLYQARERAKAQS